MQRALDGRIQARQTELSQKIEDAVPVGVRVHRARTATVPTRGGRQVARKRGKLYCYMSKLPIVLSEQRSRHFACRVRRVT